MPPLIVMKTVSIRTIALMSDPEAPMAFIIPNSLVLSFTDMSNVLIIPKALMIKAIIITVRRRDFAEPARFIMVPII